MLAPDDLEPSINSLKSFYVNTLASDKLATMNRTMVIHHLKKEAPWITEFREKTKLLYADGASWEKTKVNIIPLSLDPFLVYQNTFSSVALFLPQVTSGETAAYILQRLLEQVEQNITSQKEANKQYSRWIQDTRMNLDLLNESIEKAWGDLGSSERKITRYANQIVQTQNNIEKLEGVTSLTSINSGSITGIRSVLTNLASMSYSVIMQGYAIPYLSVGVTFFTLFKTFYDIFATAAEIHQEFENLKEYTLDLTFEEQALAQTKACLQMVYEVRSLIQQQMNSLGELEVFWKNEKRNIITVRDEFLLSENYHPDNPEVLQLKVAESVWNTLASTARTVESKVESGSESSTDIDIGK